VVELFRRFRRLRGMWRSVALIVGLAGVLAGCSLERESGAPQASARAELVVHVRRFFDGVPMTTRYTLNCSQASGTHPDPVAACGAVSDITQLGSRARLGGCVGMYSGPSVRVTGTYADRAIELSYGWLCGVSPKSLIPELRTLGIYRTSE
jgi:hypothetical protein